MVDRPRSRFSRRCRPITTVHGRKVQRLGCFGKGPCRQGSTSLVEVLEVLLMRQNLRP